MIIVKILVLIRRISIPDHYSMFCHVSKNSSRPARSCKKFLKLIILNAYGLNCNVIRFFHQTYRWISCSIYYPLTTNPLACFNDESISWCQGIRWIFTVVWFPRKF